tara:strand:+ start:4505 stop:5341 length:837 start_codon:yes stop_codon:yes gene_type:complete
MRNTAMYKICLTVLALSLLIYWIYPNQHYDPVNLSGSLQKNSYLEINSEEVMADSSKAEPLNAGRADETQYKRSAQELFDVAEQLYFCRPVPKTDIELSSWLDSAKQSGEPQSLIENILGRYEQCSALASLEQNYVVLLLEAAEQGADDAVALFWSLSDAEYFEAMALSHMSRDEKIANRSAFTKKKFGLAHAVALKGGEKSLHRLIRDYQHYDPFTEGQSYYKSVAYADFALATTGDNDFFRKIDWIKQRLLNKMSHEEIELARVLTEKLLAEATKE